MKKMYKILTFALALTLTFVLAGCGEQKPVDEDLTTTQVVNLISDLIDLEDFNFTATANASYTMSTKQGANSRQSQSNEFTNVVVKFADGGNYINVPNIVEEYSVDGWNYSKDLENNKFKVMYNNNNDDSFMAYSGEIETIVKEMFGNLVGFNPNWLSSTKLSTGAYKLTLDANLKTDLVALQQALTDYADDTLEDLINAVLHVHYPVGVSVSSIVTSLKTQITSTSTLGDVLGLVEDSFGFNISQTYAILREIITEANLPSLDTNFFALIGVESNEAFATIIDNFVVSYLQNPEITLNAFLESEGGAGIKEIYDTIIAIDINVLQVKLEITTNAQKTQVESLNILANGDVTMDDENMTLLASGTVQFSNIGSTEIIIPGITSSNIENIYLSFEFSNSDLVASTAKEISDMNLGTTNYTFVSDTDNQLVTLTYNSSTNKLTLSAEAVDDLLNSGEVIFTDSQNNVYVHLDLVA